MKHYDKDENSINATSTPIEQRLVYIQSQCAKSISTHSEQKTTKEQSTVSSDNNSNISENLPSPEDNDDPYTILIKYPPPHVIDPSFHGTIPVDDEETLMLQEKAIEEHIISLEKAGVPEEDIEAAISAYNQDIEEKYSPQNKNNESLDSEQTLEMQANDYAESLWQDTNEPVEVIEQMIDDMLRTDSMITQEETAYDKNTGLEHPEPALIDH